jgi:hypothetical protein
VCPEQALKQNKMCILKIIDTLLLLGHSTNFSSSAFPIIIVYAICIDSVPAVCSAQFVVLDLVTNYGSGTEIP